MHEGERKKEREKEGGERFETYSKIPALLVGRNVTAQAPSDNSNTSSNLHSLRQQQQQLKNSKAKEIYHFQHETTECRVFLELNCKEGMNI
jgi:hypothetical protein